MSASGKPGAGTRKLYAGLLGHDPGMMSASGNGGRDSQFDVEPVAGERLGVSPATEVVTRYQNAEVNVLQALMCRPLATWS